MMASFASKCFLICAFSCVGSALGEDKRPYPTPFDRKTGDFKATIQKYNPKTKKPGKYLAVDAKNKIVWTTKPYVWTFFKRRKDVVLNNFTYWIVDLKAKKSLTCKVNKMNFARADLMLDSGTTRPHRWKIRIENTLSKSYSISSTPPRTRGSYSIGNRRMSTSYFHGFLLKKQ